MSRPEYKAYTVMGDADCPVGVIVFLRDGLGPSKLRGAYAEQDQVGCVEFLEVKVRREPRADKYAIAQVKSREKDGVEVWPEMVEFNFVDNAFTYRDLGWSGDDACGWGEHCRRCNKATFPEEMLPKSLLNDDELCGYCREELGKEFERMLSNITIPCTGRSILGAIEYWAGDWHHDFIGDADDLAVTAFSDEMRQVNRKLRHMIDHGGDPQCGEEKK